MNDPSSLNPAQQQAVDHNGSHLIIVAGPGTGKTHTLVHRIVRFIGKLNDNVGAGPRPAQILAITFTNKAAQEMRERLEKFPDYAGEATVGTFHSFALGLLREFGDLTPLPKDFQIALPQDIQGYLEEIFPEKSSAERKEALESISYTKATKLIIDPDENYQKYQRFLRSKGAIDFDDILREALMLLENEEIQEQVCQRYPYIFVDEYQDINIVQNALLKMLLIDGEGTRGERSRTITAIGDPHQSIYGFRGSEVRFFTRFAEDFPGAVTLTLKENYRSSPNLLSASSQVIAKAPLQQVPATVASIYEQGRLVIHESPTDRAEAEYIAHQIETLVGGTSMLSQDSNRVATHTQAERSFGDIAIFYRLNAQKNVLMGALDHLGIPYSVSAKPKLTAEDLEKLTPEERDQVALKHMEEAPDFQVERVSLLTLHAAKGLEFAVVFMIGCEDSLLPLNLEGMKGDLEEERRLFYVGMTRAKENLYLTRAGRRQIFGQTRFLEPSPFLADIEEDLKAYENSKLRKKIAKSKAAEDQQLKLF